MRTHMHTHMHAHMHTDMNTYMHAHMHTHMHTCMGMKKRVVYVMYLSPPTFPQFDEISSPIELPLHSAQPTGRSILAEAPRSIPQRSVGDSRTAVMAPEASPSVQLIDGQGAFNELGLDSFVKSVRLSECGLSYAVVSIMGPQSSGEFSSERGLLLLWAGLTRSGFRSFVHGFGYGSKYVEWRMAKYHVMPPHHMHRHHRIMPLTLRMHPILLIDMDRHHIYCAFTWIHVYASFSCP
jgi:hypothetical protein